jgi:hypothetical protein
MSDSDADVGYFSSVHDREESNDVRRSREADINYMEALADLGPDVASVMPRPRVAVRNKAPLCFPRRSARSKADHVGILALAREQRFKKNAVTDQSDEMRLVAAINRELPPGNQLVNTWTYVEIRKAS